MKGKVLAIKGWTGILLYLASIVLIALDLDILGLIIMGVAFVFLAWFYFSVEKKSHQERENKNK